MPMKPSVEAQTRLELRVVSNCDIVVRGEVFKLRDRNDAGVLVLVTTMGRTIVSEEIVAVTTSTQGFLKLASYARLDGGISLHRDIG
jgi:hypothetical protein